MTVPLNNDIVTKAELEWKRIMCDGEERGSYVFDYIESLHRYILQLEQRIETLEKKDDHTDPR